MSEEIKQLKEKEQEYEWLDDGTAVLKKTDPQPHPERVHHQEKWPSDSFAWGFILIAIGLVFLFGRIGPAFLMRNWWALFLVIPAGIKLLNGFRLVSKHGRLTKAAASAFSGSLFMLTIGLIFLLGLSWSIFWPVMLVLLGLNGIMWAAAR